MAEPLGSLCLVLHGHLPYVLHHGAAPHGEAWLYEAAAETYLPLLRLIEETAPHRARPGVDGRPDAGAVWSSSRHERFKAGFVAYLNERIDRAAADRAEFEAAGDEAFARLAERWEKWYARALEHFERIGRDLPASSPGPVPRRLDPGPDQQRHARLHCRCCSTTSRAGRSSPAAPRTSQSATSAAGRGAVAAGVRLPADAGALGAAGAVPATRATAWGWSRFIAAAGLTHFFVDTHMVAGGQPVGTMRAACSAPPSTEQVHWDGRARAGATRWSRSAWSATRGRRFVFAFARHPRLSEQVWSGAIGYPGSGEYLEFHRKHGDRGLRYHRVTSHAVPPHEKARLRAGRRSSRQALRAQPALLLDRASASAGRVPHADRPARRGGRAVRRRVVRPLVVRGAAVPAQRDLNFAYDKIPWSC